VAQFCVALLCGLFEQQPISKLIAYIGAQLIERANRHFWPI